MQTITVEGKQEARDRLLEILKPGDTVFTILRHASRSGMYRVIDLVVIKPDGRGDPRYWVRTISYNAATITDHEMDRNHDGIGVTGCGMDMGFHLVYSLSIALFGHEGAYAINQAWL